MFKNLGFPLARLQNTSCGSMGVRFASGVSRATLKPLHSRKTFLIDSYKDMMENNPVVLFAHYNNLLKQENASFRSQIKEIGGQMISVRNNLFQVYLRNCHLPDPSSKVLNKDQNREHPLLPLFKGPTTAITFSETDPAKVAKLLKLLEKSADKLFIVGAKVETEVYDMVQLNQFKMLPTKTGLQAQLLGLLHILSGAGLVRTLEAGSQALYLTLQSHHDNQNSENKKD